jgi:hypothetical protein
MTDAKHRRTGPLPPVTRAAGRFSWSVTASRPT